MDLLSSGINRVACSMAPLLTYDEEIPLQITISHGQEKVYKFIRSSDRTIKFCNGEDFVQEFASNVVVLEFVENFLLFSGSYTITWHREGQKGISTLYKKETLERLLTLLVSEEIL